MSKRSWIHLGLTTVLVPAFVTSCTVYKSSDRDKFDQTAAANAPKSQGANGITGEGTANGCDSWISKSEAQSILGQDDISLSCSTQGQISAVSLESLDHGLVVFCAFTAPVNTLTINEVSLAELDRIDEVFGSIPNDKTRLEASRELLQDGKSLRCYLDLSVQKSSASRISIAQTRLEELMSLLASRLEN